MIFSNIRGTTHDKFYIGNTSTIVDVANGKELKVQENVEFPTQSNTIIFGFDASSNKYQPISDSSAKLGNVTFSGLNNSATITFGNGNINFSSAMPNDILLFNGTHWVPVSVSSIGAQTFSQNLSRGPSDYSTYQTNYLYAPIVSGIQPGQTLIIDSFSIKFPTWSFIPFDVFMVDVTISNYPIVPDTQLFGYLDNNLALTQLPIPFDSSVERTYSSSSFAFIPTNISSLVVVFNTNLNTQIPTHTIKTIYTIK